MLRRVVMLVIGVAFAVFGAAQVSAHHGWSEYNNDKTLNLTGKVQKVNYESPHVTIQLETPEKVWIAVLAPPSRMQNRGLPQDGLRAGMAVSVAGYAHRSESGEMRAERIILDGKTVELR